MTLKILPFLLPSFSEKKTEVSNHLLSYNENIAINCRIVSEGPVTEMPRT